MIGSSCVVVVAVRRLGRREVGRRDGTRSPSCSTGRRTRTTAVSTWPRPRAGTADAGLTSTIIEPGDTPSLEILGAGKADVGAHSVQEELVPARAKGLPVVSIGAVIQHNTSSLVSLRSAGIARPRDLAGPHLRRLRRPPREGPGQEAVGATAVTRTRSASSTSATPTTGSGCSAHQYDVVWIFDGWDGIRLREIDKLAINRIPFIDSHRLHPRLVHAAHRHVREDDQDGPTCCARSWRPPPGATRRPCATRRGGRRV